MYLWVTFHRRANSKCQWRWKEIHNLGQGNASGITQDRSGKIQFEHVNFKLQYAGRKHSTLIVIFGLNRLHKRVASYLWTAPQDIIPMCWRSETDSQGLLKSSKLPLSCMQNPIEQESYFRNTTFQIYKGSDLAVLEHLKWQMTKSPFYKLKEGNADSWSLCACL